MKVLRFMIRGVIKLLVFCISVSFAIIKFILGIAIIVLSLGAVGSKTSKY